MHTKRTLVSAMAVLLLILAFGAVGVGAKVYELDLSKAEDAALIVEPLPNWPVYVQTDPFGDVALFYPQGDASMAPPSDVYQSMRYAVLDTPDIYEFSLSVDQLGVGGERAPTANANVVGGNRSLSFVFGWEDVKNWWVIYFTYTDSTSVRKYVDGKQTYVCRPYELEQWMPDNFNYQNAEVRVTRDGDEMLIQAYANGEPISIDGCRIPAADYRPGKVGLGGHSTSGVQSWYLKNINLEILD